MANTTTNELLDFLNQHRVFEFRTPRQLAHEARVDEAVTSRIRTGRKRQIEWTTFLQIAVASGIPAEAVLAKGRELIRKRSHN